jgi:hypothetical protein
LEQLLEQLLPDAYDPKYGDITRHNVVTTQGPPVSDAVTLFLLECGSAYHEWRAVFALQAAGHRIKRVVLMESHIEPSYADTWAKLAEIHDVELVVLDSYVSLSHWVQNEENTGQTTKYRVVYINGALKFTYREYNEHCPFELRRAATCFWKWCQHHAINEPWNCMNVSRVRPAMCCTWDALAEVFTE